MDTSKERAKTRNYFSLLAPVVILIMLGAHYCFAWQKDGVAFADSPSTLANRARSNFVIDSNLNPLINQLYRSSPTFRAQFLTLRSNPRLYITLRLSIQALTFGPITQPPGLARIYHVQNRVYCQIEITAGSNYYYVIPHELEHCIEAAEGLYRSDTLRKGQGLYVNEYGQRETERAISAGWRAYNETFKKSNRIEIGGDVCSMSTESLRLISIEHRGAAGGL